MSSTSPLRRDPVNAVKTDLHDMETNDLKKHYMIAANGLYGNHQYADASLILKRKHPGF